MRQYYFYRRKGIYYAELVTETGYRLPAKSTKTRNRDEAAMIVGDWIRNGLPTRENHAPRLAEAGATLTSILRAVKRADLDAEGAMKIAVALRERELLSFNVAAPGPGKEKFIGFLLRFWDTEHSPYLKDKKAHGHKITQKYCRSSVQIIERHWEPYFGNSKVLGEIARKDLREFSISLSDKGLASATINNAMIVGTTALRWAHIEGFIPVDPTEGLITFTGDKTNRDVLTEEETEALFRIEWTDARAYIAALLSLTTGIRSGEIRALRRESIGEAVLDISWSFSDSEGLKRPKNGEPRRVPLLPEIRAAMFSLLESNPHKERENPFIFYSENPDRPCSAELFRRDLKRAIKESLNNPLDWLQEPPQGKGNLWVIKGEKNIAGDLQGEWSDPAPASGKEKRHRAKTRQHYYEYLYQRADTKPEKPKGIEIGDRRIDFHSFRHIFASRMANRMAADKVAKVTGHRSKAAAKIYQDHVTARILSEAGAEAAKEFENIMGFAKRGA
jgi:integrase